MALATFRVFLSVHVVSSLTCVVTGALAALSKKRPGWHTRVGEVYYWSFTVVFVSATGLSVLRWSTDAYLFVIGVVAFGFATLGYTARKVRWMGWRTAHISGMGLSYIALLTAFYVDNGPHLPLWQRLPSVAFWVLPSLIGLPLVLRALVRQRREVAVAEPSPGRSTYARTARSAVVLREKACRLERCCTHLPKRRRWT